MKIEAGITRIRTTENKQVSRSVKCQALFDNVPDKVTDDTDKSFLKCILEINVCLGNSDFLDIKQNKVT